MECETRKASMASEFPLFNYARSSVTIHDPDQALARGAESGQFDTRNPRQTTSASLLAALESNGRMPIAGSARGFSVPQVVCAVVGAVLVLGAIALILATRAMGGIIAGGILGLIGVLVLALAAVSMSRRRKNMEKIAAAWNNGWLCFAPARVGGVWISGVTRHSGRRDDEHSRGRDNDIRFRYRAVVRVYPTDGSPEFEFVSEEFSAPASRRGQPVNLKMMEGPLDHFEPEFSNGWTIARWVAGNPESATVTTDLSQAQVRAGLRASGAHLSK